MSITKDSGRQYVLSTDFLTVGFADLEDSGVLPAFDLPANAAIVGGEVIVDTIWDQTATIDVGDADDPDRYTAVVINLETLGVILLDLDIDDDGESPHIYLEADTVDITCSSAVELAATGSFRIRLQYVVQNRTNENMG